ncbi:uncharacterized protein LOC129593753 [Paramacrobiotus metropolitanus]|uniref:uncharacterized protein LOC129593753 n=1 Tax=Paramacrobiotus metropolitanus TaxID=2943436 RepID=UPI0024456F5D|nr:uncharacterized protein LOC129593753 [Paramacrobiotus metropolitanus]
MAFSACAVLYNLNTLSSSNFLTSALMAFMVVTYPVPDINVCSDFQNCRLFYTEPPTEMAHLRHPYNFLLFENGTILLGQAWPQIRSDGTPTPLVIAIVRGTRDGGYRPLSQAAVKVINSILDCSEEYVPGNYQSIRTAVTALQTPMSVLRFRRGADLNDTQNLTGQTPLNASSSTNNTNTLPLFNSNATGNASTNTDSTASFNITDNDTHSSGNTTRIDKPALGAESTAKTTSTAAVTTPATKASAVVHVATKAAADAGIALGVLALITSALLVGYLYVQHRRTETRGIHNMQPRNAHRPRSLEVDLEENRFAERGRSNQQDARNL